MSQRQALPAHLYAQHACGSHQASPWSMARGNADLPDCNEAGAKHGTAEEKPLQVRVAY